MRAVCFRIAFLLSFTFLASCASDYERLRELPKNDFVTQQMTEWEKPFTAIWVDPKIKEQKIAKKKVFIKGITLDYIQPPLEGDRRETWARRLALYFDQQLTAKIKEDPVASSRVINSPEKAQYIMEPALVQVNRTMYGLNFLSFGTSFFIPMITYAFNPFTYGEMTLMVRIKDAKTGKVYITFADYKKDEPTVFGSVRDFTPYGHHFKTVDMWTDKLSHLIGAEPGTEIKKETWITLNPF